MEKVVVAQGLNDLNSRDVKEVNELLSQGWTVKFVSTTATNDYVTAVFILQLG